jgi:hypothetical protein
MVSFNLNAQLLRAGLSVAAALLLSSAAIAQDAVVVDVDVMYAVDPIIEVDPMIDGDVDNGITDDGTTDDGWDDGIFDDGSDDGATDDGSDDGIVDDGSDDDWLWEDDDTIIWIDDGLCIGVGCTPGDETDPDAEEGVIYYFGGGRPEDCPECRDLTSDIPVEIYQMSAGGPVVTDTETAPAAKPRRNRAASSTASNAAECLALYPQLPWLCEWQNNTGQ